MKIEKSILYIILLVFVIIALTPVIFILPAFNAHFDFSKTGAIGDTLGGITAPFINGLAAILVYVAFRSQIKANEKLQEANDRFEKMELNKIFLEELSSIKNEFNTLIESEDLLNSKSIDNIPLHNFDNILGNLERFSASYMHVKQILFEKDNFEKNYYSNKYNYDFLFYYKPHLNNIKGILINTDVRIKDSKTKKTIIEINQKIDGIITYMASINQSLKT